MNQSITKFTACAQGAAAVVFKKTKSLVKNPRVAMVAALLLVFTVSTFAQDTQAGISAIDHINRLVEEVCACRY